MTVLLTSFKRYHEEKMEIPGYSIAVYQPRWYKLLPKMALFDIREDGIGMWTLPRYFVFTDRAGKQTNTDEDVLRRYRDRLLEMYETRVSGRELPSDLYEDIALCCWCPYEKAAKRQIETYGTFVCHSVAVEAFLQKHGIDVVRDKDRERMVRI